MERVYREGGWPQLDALMLKSYRYTVNNNNLRTLVSIVLVDCGVPFNASHALITYNQTVEGEEAIYECEHTYGFDDGSTNVTVTCLANGTWAQLWPSCLLSK